ncbi:MAG: hypothetical protein JG764_1162 [Clostridiales bacterium]|jgi:hypothetical protein|nr:hypothetical protein [Clostridiales bacterium]
MNAEKRRKEILNKLVASQEPITGNELSTVFNVSRQVIVQDIAVLRAAGNEILATPSGYLVINTGTDNKIKKIYAVKHSSDELEKELLIMVDSGGKVLDVIVEHALYGELKGLLMLACREDVYAFVKKLKETGAKPLSSLTTGIHLHTVEAPNEEIHNKIAEKLKKEGILLEDDYKAL